MSSVVSFGMKVSPAVRQRRLDDRMPPGDDAQRRVVGQHRADVAVLHGAVGEGAEDIDLRDRARRAEQHRGRRADLAQDAPVQLLLARRDPLLGVEDRRLPLLEGGRDEPLGVRERLRAAVVLRDMRQVRARDLDAVAEDAVVLDLQRADAGALALRRLHRRDRLLRVRGGVDEMIEIARRSRAGCGASAPCPPARGRRG